MSLLCRVILFVIGFSWLCVGQAQGQSPYHDDRTHPAGILGQRIDDVLEAANSSDPNRIRGLITGSFAPEFRDAFSMEEHVNVFLDVHDRSLGLDFYGIRSYPEGGTPGGTVVILRNQLTEGWQALVLDLEPESPNRIRSLRFVPARPPSDLPPAPPVTPGQAVQELETMLSRLAEAEAFSGAVLLAKDGKILFEGAFGLAHRGFGVANRVDTKFNLGSMNKMFTAVAVTQLVAAGKLSFTDPVSKYLDPDWLPRVDKSRVRVEHLLTHTSGLGSYFNDRYMDSSRELFRSVDDYKRLVADDTLAFEPGTQWSYSNTGFLLLGAVIESASGEDYFEYMREHVYRPAGMVNSDCYEMDLAVPNLAIGYDRERSPEGTVRWRNNLYSHVIKGGPAGGGFSTVEDLFRFGEALRGGNLVSRQMVDMLWSPKPTLQSPEYGFGFAIESGAWGRRVGHSGGFPGISSALDLYLDSGYTAVVLSNMGGASFAVKEKLQELIPRLTE